MGNTGWYGLQVDWNGDADFGTEYNRATDNPGFESGVAPWSGSVPGFATCTVVQNNTHVHGGNYAGRVTWPYCAGQNGSAIGYEFSGLTIGERYLCHVSCWVPSGQQVVTWVDVGPGGSYGWWSTENDVWTTVHSGFFVATKTNHIFAIVRHLAGAAGQYTWVDDLICYGMAGDLIWQRLRGPLHFGYGRDQARTLNPMGPSEASFTLDNQSGDYSPEKETSPLYPNVRPGKEVSAWCAYPYPDTYALFRGYINNFDLNPGRADMKINFTAVDQLTRLSQVTLSTPMYEGKRIGDLINVVLDEAGWVGNRDIDLGATVVRYWWEQGTNAQEALEKLVASEGEPAILYVAPDSTITFRDRLHRLNRSASTSVQATATDLKDASGELRYGWPFGYDHGWNEIVNTCELSVIERVPGPWGVIWESEDRREVPANGSVTVEIVMQDGFLDAADPDWFHGDFLCEGPGIGITVSRHSGGSLILTIENTDSNPDIVHDIKVYGVPLVTVPTVMVRARDETSIDEVGEHHAPSSAEPVWAGVHDAQAIADLLVALRKDRVPTVTVTLPGVDQEMIVQQLARKLSDRVHIENHELDLDADFYIERVEHDIAPRASDTGHATTWACGKVMPHPDTYSELFRFDQAGKGFNDGKFAH